ncbi:hypothetical protein [Clostridium sporogenes]|uniref:hypothetical protein n=1 Tax=Clostridium sporogenes TaxID=1509 RepID=UPI0006B289B2|nr:hypothetical protein [Clostridium sporogenes]KOY66103.1 hypothetical protein AN649_09835 [Clostridium sporogenes]MDS1006471.1 hypothetical protein [Clostridium sporogenes]
MKCTTDINEKDCCYQETCCEECDYENCHEGCVIFEGMANCGKVGEKYMKKVIVDRGIYKLGVIHANGDESEPNWISDLNGNSLIIGHEENEFSISSVYDVEFILKELSEKLGLDFVAKVEKTDFGTDENYFRCSRCKEVFDNQGVPGEGERRFCYNCGAVLDWSEFENEEE